MIACARARNSGSVWVLAGAAGVGTPRQGVPGTPHVPSIGQRTRVGVAALLLRTLRRWAGWLRVTSKLMHWPVTVTRAPTKALSSSTAVYRRRATTGVR
jgi:hypothetical protein